MAPDTASLSHTREASVSGALGPHGPAATPSLPQAASGKPDNSPHGHVTPICAAKSHLPALGSLHVGTLTVVFKDLSAQGPGGIPVSSLVSRDQPEGSRSLSRCLGDSPVKP